MRRVILIIIALLFILSSVVSVFAIILASRQQTSPSALQNAQKQAAECGTKQPTPLAAKEPPKTYIVTTPVTKLETTDLTVGSGKTVTAGDCIDLFYHGTYAADGTAFNGGSNFASGAVYESKTTSFVPGFAQGLVGMRVGGTRRIVIPSDLAYGSSGACAQPDPSDPKKCKEYAIPPNTALVFVVEVVAIKS